MQAMTFDTLRVLEKLKQSDFSDAQAKGIIDAFRDVDTSEVATKKDLQELKLQMGAMMAMSVGLLATLIVVFGRVH